MGEIPSYLGQGQPLHLPIERGQTVNAKELAAQLTKAIETNDTNALYGVVVELLKETKFNTIAELRAQYEESIAIYERLTLETFDSSNEEDYEDTVERLYNQGYSDALQLAITLLTKENN